MKNTFAILAIASVNAACECLTEENGLPAPSFFTDAGYPADYGSMCSPWDSETENCMEGGENFGEDWCTSAWCYVSSENTCVTDRESGWDVEGLNWSLAVCAQQEDSSMALYASTMAATVAVIAASV